MPLSYLNLAFIILTLDIRLLAASNVHFSIFTYPVVVVVVVVVFAEGRRGKGVLFFAMTIDRQVPVVFFFFIFMLGFCFLFIIYVILQ